MGLYIFEFFGIGEDIMGGLSFMDFIMRDLNMMDVGLWWNCNSRWVIGNLDLFNFLFSLLLDSVGLIGFLFDGFFFVFGGRLFSDSLFGFFRRSFWDMFCGLRNMNRFFF